MVKLHQSSYQDRDYDVVDYNLSELEGTPFTIRGPAPASMEEPYFSVIGAAQAFGVLCRNPFAHLVSQKIDMPCLNMGFGGVGPEFFLRNKCLIDYINKSKFCIVQVMSGRSVSNSRSLSLGSEYGFDRVDTQRKSVHKIFDDEIHLYNKSSLRRTYEKIMSKFLDEPIAKSQLKDLVSETRARWVQDYIKLSYLISVPTILLWMSTRYPKYKVRAINHETLFGAFPQLVNQMMIEKITPYFGPYVESVSSEGLPQILINRFTGKPAICDRGKDRQEFSGTSFSINYYYPSPEMHIHTSRCILNTISKWKEYLLD